MILRKLSLFFENNHFSKCEVKATALAEKLGYVAAGSYMEHLLRPQRVVRERTGIMSKAGSSR